MKTYNRYSKGFKEQALVKVYSRSNDQTIETIAKELNINVTTLKDWMRQSKKTSNKTATPTSKSPMGWSPEERLTALQQSYSRHSAPLPKCKIDLNFIIYNLSIC